MTGKQVCMTFIGMDPWSRCSDGDHSATCIDVTNDAGMSASELEQLGFNTKCLAACPSCSCGLVLKSNYGATVTCQDLPGGGMMVHQVAATPGGCYGCPPARVA